MLEVATRQRAQISQIGAKDDGEVVMDVVEVAMVVGEDRGVEKGVLVVVEDGVVEVYLIPWHATGMGCVAIWPVTIPPLVAHQRVVAILAPLEEVR